MNKYQPSKDKKEKLNILTIAAMVVGIIAIILGWVIGLGFVLGVFALILGIIGLKHKYGGKSMAITGITTGAIAIIWNIIISVLFILTLFASGNAILTIDNTTTVNSTTLATLTAAKKDFAKGEVGIFGQFNVSVNSVTRNFVSANNNYKLASGRELVVLNISVKNTGTTTASLASYELTITKPGDFRLSLSAIPFSDNYYGASIEPDSIESGNLVADIPYGATGLQLQYEMLLNKEDGKTDSLLYTIEI